MIKRITFLIVFSLLLSVPLVSWGDPHVMLHPDDYLIKEDIKLTTGRVVPKGTLWYKRPDYRRLKREMEAGMFKGDQRWGQKILFGREIIYDTYYTVGEGRRDGMPALTKGRLINCTNCHALEGTMPYAWPFFRTLTHFGLEENGDSGELFGNLGYHRDTRIRIRDCSRHCGGVVEIPSDSLEMEALLAWITVVRDGIYEGEGLLIPEFKTKADADKIPGARIPLFTNVLNMKADPERGHDLYHRFCVNCHGADGEGIWRAGDGYAVPPVAGSGSFSNAGGPVMVPVGAAFLKYNMPLMRGRMMEDQDALDTMAYLATLPRDTVWWEPHYFRHNPCGRPAFLPLHIGTVPRKFPFSPEQVKFGPWQAISDWLKSDVCTAANPKTEPLLKVDFDTRKPVQ